MSPEPISDRATRAAIAETSAVFDAEAMTGCDDATWALGRGWAPATGLTAYTVYAATDLRVAAQTTRQITAALTG